MGVADLLYMMRIPYNSQEGYDLMSRLAEALTYYSMDESVRLAEERGSFPLCGLTEYPQGDLPVEGYYGGKGTHDWDGLVARIRKAGIRNVLTTTVAPTGTISMIAACSNGVEPTFALAYEKRVSAGRFFYKNLILQEALISEGLDADSIFQMIASNRGSLDGIEAVPEWIRKVFVTAMDIHWADHILAQSAWQKWICNAIAKTINMPNGATPEDVKSAYVMAHDLGLKGITVYRDGSRNEQVLHAGDGGRVPRPSRAASSSLNERARARDAKAHHGDHCATCGGHLSMSEGCCICLSCGRSSCCT